MYTVTREYKIMPKGDRYWVIDRLTGEEMSMDDYERKMAVEEAYPDENNPGYFELTEKNTLIRFIECGGNPSCRILATLLRKKGKNGLINITQQQLVDTTGSSKHTVNEVMKRLQTQQLLRKLRQGRYVLDPGISVYGGAVKKMAMRYWENMNG